MVNTPPWSSSDWSSGWSSIDFSFSVLIQEESFGKSEKNKNNNNGKLEAKVRVIRRKSSSFFCFRTIIVARCVIVSGVCDFCVRLLLIVSSQRDFCLSSCVRGCVTHRAKSSDRAFCAIIVVGVSRRECGLIVCVWSVLRFDRACVLREKQEKDRGPYLLGSAGA